jgi:hypothetical protein
VTVSLSLVGVGWWTSASASHGAANVLAGRLEGQPSTPPLLAGGGLLHGLSQTFGSAIDVPRTARSSEDSICGYAPWRNGRSGSAHLCPRPAFQERVLLCRVGRLSRSPARHPVHRQPKPPSSENPLRARRTAWPRHVRDDVGGRAGHGYRSADLRAFVAASLARPGPFVGERLRLRASQIEARPRPMRERLQLRSGPPYPLRRASAKAAGELSPYPGCIRF